MRFPQWAISLQEGMLDMVSHVAYTTTHIVLDSYESQKTCKPLKLPSNRGRLQVKRIVERFLCLRPDDASSHLQASISVTRPEKPENGARNNLANKRFSWLGRKDYPQKSKKEDVNRDENVTADTDDDDEKEEKVEEEEEEEEDPLAPFRAVLRSMDLDTLPDYASTIRRSHISEEMANDPSMECSVGYTPMAGSYHILLPVTFTDGTEWLFKVPAAGYAGRWDSSAARALRSEALTMQLLEQKTSIPAPKVYGFDSTLDNEFKCPFILMERINGQPLYEKWYDGFISKEEQEKFREQALRSLAAAAVQLSSFRYPQAGAPSFDDEGDVTTIEPLRTVDAPAMHSRTPYPDNNDDLFCEVGPHDSTEAYLSSVLGRHRQPKHVLGQAIHHVLRMFIGWVSSDTSIQNQCFTLAHPDFNLQNVLVAEDGTVKALIDWDGVATVPRSLGCPFPKWLTLDWDRFYYNFNREIDCDREDRHHSPEEMKHYRALYAKFVEEATSEMKGRSNTPSHELAEITRKSILIDSVNRATKNPFSTSNVVFDILEKIAHLTSQSFFEIKGDVYSDDKNQVEWCESTEEIDTAPIKQSSSAGSSEHGDSDLPFANWAAQSDITPSEISPQQNLSQTNVSQQGAAYKTNGEHTLPGHSSMISVQDNENNGPTSVSVEVNGESSQSESRSECSSTSLSSGDDRSSSQEQSSNTSSRTSDSPSYSDAASLLLMHRACTSELKASLERHQEASQTSDRAIGSMKLERNHKVESKATNMTDVSLPLLTRCPEVIHNAAQLGAVHIDSGSRGSGVSGLRVEQKGGLRQRLKKLAIEKSKAINARSMVFRRLSASSEGSEVTPAPVTSRRRRIIDWIKNTSHMSGIGTVSFKSAEEVNRNLKSDAILPKIPQNSNYSLLNTKGSNVETNTDKAEVENAVGARSYHIPQLGSEHHLKIASYDSGEPVDEDTLYNEGFTPAQICYDLMDGTLDEARMQRLKQGFTALLDSL